MRSKRGKNQAKRQERSNNTADTQILEDSVVFIDPKFSQNDTVVKLPKTSNKPPQQWLRNSRPRNDENQQVNQQVEKFEPFEKAQGQDDIRPLPYLHKKINLDHLNAQGRLSPLYARQREFNGQVYLIYKQGVLGEGSFGEVVLAQNKDTGEWIALKRIKDPKADQSLIDLEVGNLDKSKELMFHTKQNGENYIGMKLRKGVELREMLGNPNLGQAQRLLVAKKILKATVDIHFDTKTMVSTTGHRGFDLKNRQENEFRLLHRDIKPENMMIDAALNVGHIDLGLAGNINRNNQAVRDGRMGTPPFMAPELLFHKRVTYNEKTDVFALGISLMEIFNLHRQAFITEDGKTFYPKYGRGFSNEEYEAYSNSGAHFRYVLDPHQVSTSNIDPKLHDLIVSMTNNHPNMRPSVIQAYAEMNKIMDNSVNNNQRNPEGLRAYAISIEAYAKAQANGKLDQFVQKIMKRGVNSIAFYSTNPQVSHSLLIAAQRTFTDAGIAHIVPDLYNNRSAHLNLQRIESYYSRTFGTIAVKLDHDAVFAKADIGKIIEDYASHKNADKSFVEKAKNIHATQNTQQALAKLVDMIIEKMSSNPPGPSDFFKNGGKQLIQNLLECPDIGNVLEERSENHRATRAVLLKACVLPQLHSFVREKFVDKVDEAMAKKTAVPESPRISRAG